MLVATEEDFKQRQMQWEQEDQKLAEQRRNSGFTQVYPAGWNRINSLILKSPNAARLYALLARHIEPSCGAVVASQELLASELNCSIRTIQRYLNVLESESCLVKIRLMGTVNAYALNPDEVWKSWDTSKAYAAFHTKTLASMQSNNDVKRRLMVMLKNQDKTTTESDKDEEEITREEF